MAKLLNHLPSYIAILIKTFSKIVSLNEQVKTMANEKGIEFIDVHDFFAESDGITAMKEYIRSVHLSDSGKQLWCSLLAPYMH